MTHHLIRGERGAYPNPSAVRAATATTVRREKLTDALYSPPYFRSPR